LRAPLPAFIEHFNDPPLSLALAALISPRYNTWRCTTLPSAQRLASTMFQ
jgi:hypothetical protein